MSRTKVLLADDHILLLEAFKRLLEPEFEVVGTVADGRVSLVAVRTLNPDVIALDNCHAAVERSGSSSATAREVAAPQADFPDHESGSGSSRLMKKPLIVSSRAERGICFSSVFNEIKQMLRFA